MREVTSCGNRLLEDSAAVFESLDQSETLLDS
jgi:hypothetical protein